MIECIVIISSILFAICYLFLSYISLFLNIPYTHLSVYVNLYLQSTIILVSCLSVLINSFKYFKYNIKHIINLAIAIIYNGIFLIEGISLYNRYGTLSIESAFQKCRYDLILLANNIDLYCDSKYYYAQWSEYFYLNVLIFIIGFLNILLLNIYWNKRIKTL